MEYSVKGMFGAGQANGSTGRLDPVIITLDSNSKTGTINCMKVPPAMESSESFPLGTLCELADLPKRTVRYYIQLGLVDRPIGETRAARYTSHHLEQLLQIRKWSEAGVSLERIRDLLSGKTPPVPPRPRGAGTVEVWSHLVVADGLEVTLEPGRAGLTPEQAREFFRGALALYDTIRKQGAS